MKKPSNGTEHSEGFEVEIATSWRRWAKRRTDEELIEVRLRCSELAASFGQRTNTLDWACVFFGRSIMSFVMGKLDSARRGGMIIL